MRPSVIAGENEAKIASRHTRPLGASGGRIDTAAFHVIF